MASFRPTLLDWVCFGLVFVGAINWGIVGVLELNAVEAVLDPVFEADAAEVVARSIYVLVGLAGVYFLYPLYRIARYTERRSHVR